MKKDLAAPALTKNPQGDRQPFFEHIGFRHEHPGGNGSLRQRRTLVSVSDQLKDRACTHSAGPTVSFSFRARAENGRTAHSIATGRIASNREAMPATSASGYSSTKTAAGALFTA